MRVWELDTALTRIYSERPPVVFSDEEDTGGMAPKLVPNRSWVIGVMPFGASNLRVCRRVISRSYGRRRSMSGGIIAYSNLV